jgi:hypothetical protein
MLDQITQNKPNKPNIAKYTGVNKSEQISEWRTLTGYVQYKNIILKLTG